MRTPTRLFRVVTVGAGRAHLAVRSTSDGGITTRDTVDTVDADGRRTASDQQTLRLKYACVARTPSGNALARKLGAQDTPCIVKHAEIKF